MSTQDNLQALVNGLSAQWQRERAASQMTLGKMIETLAAMPASTEIQGLAADAHSYRGYYSDLAFEPTHGKVTAGALLEECRAAMGEVFEGYKGGEYVMGSLTPVWLASYGCCGKKIMAINADGCLETAEDELNTKNRGTPWNNCPMEQLTPTQEALARIQRIEQRLHWIDQGRIDIDLRGLADDVRAALSPAVGAQPLPAQPEGESHPNAINQMKRERDGWREEAEVLLRRCKLAEADLDLRRAMQERDVWFFQGDGEDHIESMGNRMVVVIHASDLRHLIATTPPAPSEPAQPVPAGGVGWLIESKGFEGHIHYLAAQGPHLCYTSSADLALRFSRKEDAAALFEVYAHSQRLSGNHRWRESFTFTEHMWA